MKDFIRDYVKGYLDFLGVDTEENKYKIEKVVMAVCLCDEWADVLDKNVLEACDRFGIPVKEDE